HRSEGNEPGMVAAAPRVAIRAPQRDRLRRAGLARDLDATHPSGLAGAPVGHHDVSHAGAHLLQRLRVDPRLAQHVGLHLLAYRAVRRQDPLDVLRAIAGAAVRDRRREVRHLERRRGDVALPDRHREGLAREPGTMEPALLPLRVGNRAALLVLEPDARGEPETEAPRVLGDEVHAETLSGLVEEDVAGLDDGLVEAHVAMPAMAPAAEEVVAER